MGCGAVCGSVQCGSVVGSGAGRCAMDEQDKEIWAWTIGGIAVMLAAPTVIGFLAYWFMRLFDFGWELAAGI